MAKYYSDPADRPFGWPERWPKTAYLAGAAVIIGFILVQYLITGENIIAGLGIAYAIPTIIVSLLAGRAILPGAAKNPKASFFYGLVFFSVFTVASQIANLMIQGILTTLDPLVLSSLSRHLPQYNLPLWAIWAMLPASFLIVGPVEEYLFRGFIFGGLIRLFGSRRWLYFAVLSSLLFAAVHLYYFLTFGVASAFFFVDIFAFGLAMSFAYYRAGGSLVGPIVLHGLYDSSAFLGNATNFGMTIAVRYILVAVGFYLFLTNYRSIRGRDDSRRTDSAAAPPAAKPAI